MPTIVLHPRHGHSKLGPGPRAPGQAADAASLHAASSQQRCPVLTPVVQAAPGRPAQAWACTEQLRSASPSTHLWAGRPFPCTRDTTRRAEAAGRAGHQAQHRDVVSDVDVVVPRLLLVASGGQHADQITARVGGFEPTRAAQRPRPLPEAIAHEALRAAPAG